MKARAAQFCTATEQLVTRDGGTTPSTDTGADHDPLADHPDRSVRRRCRHRSTQVDLYPAHAPRDPRPAVATVVASIALAWLARRYAAAARPIATTTLGVLALVGWFTGTGPSVQGYGAFSLLLILAGLALAAVSLIRAIAAGMEFEPTQESTTPAPTNA
ncbi:hypothetical protein Rwratislav_38903 [Rhodococcus wratislaviensis IFP 2016]|nr:hypothetical protein Rwratislav_38903 [Rhodococcus wratislaviensis IFP 2016]